MSREAALVALVPTVIALAVSAIRLWILAVSRRPANGDLHALAAEDFQFWVDWFAAGIVSVGTKMIIMASAGEAPSVSFILACLGYLAVAVMIFPPAWRATGYASDGQLRPERVKWANLAGFLFLLWIGTQEVV